MEDFNEAGEQRDVIPAGTVATVQLTVRPGGVGEGGWLKRAKDGNSEGLDCEFVLLDGQYAKRKFWTLFTLNGTTENHAEAGRISRSTIRAMLESASRDQAQRHQRGGQEGADDREFRRSQWPAVHSPHRCCAAEGRLQGQEQARRRHHARAPELAQGRTAAARAKGCGYGRTAANRNHRRTSKRRRPPEMGEDGLAVGKVTLVQQIHRTRLCHADPATAGQSRRDQVAAVGFEGAVTPTPISM